MTRAAPAPHRPPVWSWVFPLAGLALLAGERLGLLAAGADGVAALAAVAVVGAVFASVHHAEIVAARLGQPYGSLVLAAAVTAIETSLILSVLLSAGANAPITNCAGSADQRTISTRSPASSLVTAVTRMPRMPTHVPIGSIR